MRTLPRNVTQFKLDGWPLDALDQTAMVEIRKLADQTGWTVAEVIREVTQEYVARRQAENDLPAKILKFPKRQASRIAASSSTNAVSTSSACTIKRSASLSAMISQ
jgi:hypothetical protein